MGNKRVGGGEEGQLPPEKIWKDNVPLDISYELNVFLNKY